MTLVRRLALKISDAVVRWAAPGSSEWAEGLAREVEFIEGDWAALGWAIGSSRVLLDLRGTAPFTSQSPAFRNLFFWFMVAGQIFVSCFEAFKATSGTERTGWVLVALGWSYWEISSVFNWVQERTAPPSRDVVATLLFGRAKLERRLERYRSGKRWFPLLATAAIISGLVLIVENATESGHILTAFIVSGGEFAEWLQSLDTPEKIQQRLVRVDELIAKRTGTGGL